MAHHQLLIAEETPRSKIITQRMILIYKVEFPQLARSLMVTTRTTQKSLKNQ
jgi:hypothetical protein